VFRDRSRPNAPLAERGPNLERYREHPRPDDGGSRLTAFPPSSSDHPETWKFGYPIYHAETRAQWRAWLGANHDAARGVWLCSWRAPSGKPRCPYPEVVEEAICFGWIDSTVNPLDEHRGLQLLTPRRPKSAWTRLNRQRAADMECAGLMTDAGRQVVEIARGNGWWTIADPVEDLVEPDNLATALNANAAARSAWDGFPPSARKMMLWWVISATKDDTKAIRIATIVAKATTGERAQG
jgi:uncharacterized protein YdeI (YjbR/CyaY-like superfamily)